MSGASGQRHVESAGSRGPRQADTAPVWDQGVRRRVVVTGTAFDLVPNVIILQMRIYIT